MWKFFNLGNKEPDVWRVIWSSPTLKKRKEYVCSYDHIEFRSLIIQNQHGKRKYAVDVIRSSQGIRYGWNCGLSWDEGSQTEINAIFSDMSNRKVSSIIGKDLLNYEDAAWEIKDYVKNFIHDKDFLFVRYENMPLI